MKKIEIARALAAARGVVDRAQADGEDCADLSALTRLPGLGRKRARQLNSELGIDTLEELAAALLDGSVVALRGFGPEACERLKAELQRHFERSRRFDLADAEAQVKPLVEHLRAHPAAERVEVAGSVRRRCTTVGDVDLLVVSSRPTQVMRHFAAFPDADRVEATDASRGCLVLQCGLRVDVRVVPRRCYGATLQFLTGSPAHNAEIRQLGLDRGFRISEYGIFSVDHARAGARRMGGQREEDIYEAIGLDWIPPELREGRGELARAGEQRLPSLVTAGSVLGDLHVSSRLATDAPALQGLAAACAARGHGYCAVVRHLRGHGDSEARSHAALPETATIDDGNTTIRILRAVVAGIGAEGDVEADAAELEAADLVIVEMRAHLRLSRSRMTDRILGALEHPLVDILSWPPARIAGRAETQCVELDEVLAAAAAHEVALEVLAAPALPDECDALFRRAAELGVRIAVGSGARSLDGLAAIRYAVDRARRGWFETAGVLNTRSADALDQWLQRRAPHRNARLATTP